MSTSKYNVVDVSLAPICYPWLSQIRTFLICELGGFFFFFFNALVNHCLLQILFAGLLYGSECWTASFKDEEETLVNGGSVLQKDAKVIMNQECEQR